MKKNKKGHATMKKKRNITSSEYAELINALNALGINKKTITFILEDYESGNDFSHAMLNNLKFNVGDELVIYQLRQQIEYLEEEMKDLRIQEKISSEKYQMLKEKVEGVEEIEGDNDIFFISEEK